MTLLRKMMLEELQRRDYAQSTAEAYIQALRESAGYYHRPPDQLGPKQISGFQLHLLRDRGLSPQTVKQHIADEFLRRFLLHTLPLGFVRIRFFGYMANRRRTAMLSLCKNLLGGNDQDTSTTVHTAETENSATWLCPLCRSRMIVTERFTAWQLLWQDLKQKDFVDTS